MFLIMEDLIMPSVAAKNKNTIFEEQIFIRHSPNCILLAFQCAEF
jgi:hypothetical protein